MAQLTKQQQIEIFQAGKQLDPRDETASAFLQEGLGASPDPKVQAQRNCFSVDGFIDPRDTTANAFLQPMTEQDYARVPEHIKKQMEQFTGSFQPENWGHPSANDFMENN